MVTIRYFAPAPALRCYISSYYWFQSFGSCFADLMRAELPQVRFVLQGRALNHYGNGVVRISTAAHLQGPTNGPVRFTASEPLHVFGAGLLPLGWAALVGEAADRLSDDLVDLADVFGPPARQAHEELLAATHDRGRVAVADRLFTTLLDTARPAPAWFVQLADDWLTASPAPSVDALVTASGMSARSVERLTGRIYGASPKLLARKYRALGAAVRLGNGEAAGWSDLTDDGLFYDQAHVIREFNQFIGMTPARFLAEAAPVTRLTIARRRLMPDLPKLALFS